MQQCCQWGMLCRHMSGFEQVLNKILGKSLEELPLHGVLVRGLYHAACMALEFVIECQSSLTTWELSFSIPVCCVLHNNFMYKSLIHATDEVFKVPFPGPLIPSLNFIYILYHVAARPVRVVPQRSTLMESLWSPVTLYTQNQWSNPFNQVSNTLISSSPEYFSGVDTLIFLISGRASCSWPTWSWIRPL